MTTPVPVNATASPQTHFLARGESPSRPIDPSTAGGKAADDHAAPFVRRDTFTPVQRTAEARDARLEGDTPRSASLRSREGEGERSDSTLTPDSTKDVDSSAAEVSGRGIDAPGNEAAPTPPPPPVAPAQSVAALVDVGSPRMDTADALRFEESASSTSVSFDGATIVEYDAGGVHTYNAFHFPTSRVEPPAIPENRPSRPDADPPGDEAADEAAANGVTDVASKDVEAAEFIEGDPDRPLAPEEGSTRERVNRGFSATA